MKKEKSTQKTVTISPPKKPLGKRIAKDISRNWILYLLLIPGIFVLICFKIGPMGGLVISFEKFSPFLGVFKSPWVGLDNFKRILADQYMGKLVRNTIILAVLSIVVVFPFPVIFSLFLNEVRIKKVRTFTQVLSFFPYFISTAVMVSILSMLVNPSTGLVNKVIEFFGGKAIYFMGDPKWFRPLYVILQIWHTFGYSTVIYIASMSAIDTSLYDAAEVDGCGRFQRMWYITLPEIANSVVVMLIISIGSIFSVDLDRILLMYNSAVYETADVIQSYVYRIGFMSTGFPDYSYGAAVNMLKSVIAFILVIFANKLAKKYSETRLF